MNIEILKETGALLEGHFELSSGLHSDKYVQCAKLLQTSKSKDMLNDLLSECLWDFDSGRLLIERPDVVIGGAYGGIRFASLIAWRFAFDFNVRGIWCERVPEIKICRVKSERSCYSCENIERDEYSKRTACKYSKRCCGGHDLKKLATKCKYYEYDNLSTIEEERIVPGKFQLRRGFEIKEREKVLIAEDVTTTGKSIGEVAELVKECGGEIVGAISIIDRRKLKDDFLAYTYSVKNDIRPFISLIQLDIQTWKPDKCPLCKDSKAIKLGSK